MKIIPIMSPITGKIKKILNSAIIIDNIQINLEGNYVIILPIDSYIIKNKTIIGYKYEITDIYKLEKVKKILKKLDKFQIKQTFEKFNDPPNNLIILTVPHEKCDGYEFHLCDYSARKLANQLMDSLKNNNREIILLSGNINRQYIDLNRYISRSTNFRKQIRQKINKNKYSKIYIIDCHSYPSKSFKNYETNDPEITILFDNPKDSIIIDILVSILRYYNIMTIKLRGIKNDIIDEFSNYQNVMPILIEINESINENKFPLIGKGINKWITFLEKKLK